MLARPIPLHLWTSLIALALPCAARADGGTVITGGGCPPSAPSPFWRNTMSVPDDPFRVIGSSPSDPGWVKFTILTCDPSTVYFQDSVAYPFHYHFAVERLTPFLGMTALQFDAVTLHLAGQQAVLGAVIMPAQGGFPSTPAFPEYGIQFVGLDAYPREMVRDLFNAVKATIAVEPGVQAYYFPTFEQQAVADEHAEWFVSEGILIGSSASWVAGNASYSDGWAFGRLNFVPAHQIQSAFLSGALKATDILMTNAVPAEIPIVAGVITLSPATPNSHVAILSQTFQIPFVHLAKAEDVARAQSLVGREITLSALDQFAGARVRLIDIEGKLSEGQRQRLIDLRTPPPLNIAPVAPYGGYTANADFFVPTDIQFFGGKATNFAILRSSIPDHCPKAMGISFDLWNEYLSQTLASGVTLRQEIANRLAPFTYPPSDMAALSSTLAGVRDLFRNPNLSSFTPAQQSAIIAALQDPQYGFDPLKNIRFRSSTNVEDTEQFTGAGLYESFSGCLADELDGDASGPSICDTTESGERGVFRAIRRVFGSFYNDNAYLERLRHGVDENQVGMAVLVHHSFPDPTEDANGVATLDRTGTLSTEFTIVTQDGASPVTNPEPGTVPELVTVHLLSGNYYPALVQHSNLVPLGASVMDFPGDYVTLAQLIKLVGDRYGVVAGRPSFVLDLEFKKDLPTGDLIIKQVREIPQPPAAAPSVVPILVNEPMELRVLQGEGGDPLARHRLKTRLFVETKNIDLSTENLSAGTFFDQVTFEFTDGCRIRTLGGELASFPSATHSFDNSIVRDGWHIADAANPRTCELRIEGVQTLLPPHVCPVQTLGDLGQGGMQFRVVYAQPVRAFDPFGGPLTWTSEDVVPLTPPLPAVPGGSPHDILFAGDGGVLVNTLYHWPQPPGGFTAGYTAPLQRWEQTVITGLTAEPIVLTGEYAQTYHPHHHNFTEEYLFDPWLEPGISPDALQELADQDVRLIHAQRGGFGPDLVLLSATELDMHCDPCAMSLAGDMNRDGSTDGRDIHPFVKALIDGPSSVAERCGADLNGDALVAIDDVDGLVAALLAE